MRWLVTVLGAAALAVTCSAAAADILIRPGAAIGKLRLGMTEAEARRAYEFPYVERESRPFGRERVEISFGLSGYSVVLHGTRGRARVVRIATLSALERTPEGVGVGSTESRLMAAYRGSLVCDRPTTFEYGGLVFYNDTRSCYLRARGVETIFRSRMIVQRRGIAQFIRKWEPTKARVAEVTVQTLPQPRF